MKKVVLISSLILVAFAVIVVSKMPASFIFSHVAKMTSSLYMDNIQGSLWQGEAKHVQVLLPAGVVGRRAKVLHLGAVEWQLDFLPLLVGSIDLQLNTQHANQSINTELVVNVFSKSLSLEETLIDVSLPFVKTLYPVPAKINGRAEMTIQRLSLEVLENKPVIKELEAQVLISELEVAVSTAVDLGDFGINLFSDDAGIINASVTDIDASVGVTGKGQLNQTSLDYSMNAEIVPNEKTSGSVIQALKFVSSQQANGHFSINHKGSLK